MTEDHRPLSLPALLQRVHELVSARVPGGYGPLVNGDRPGLLALELDLQLLHSSVFHYLLAQRRLLLREWVPVRAKVRET